MIRIYKQGTNPLYELLEEIHPTNTTTYVDTGIFTSSAISFEVLCKCNPNRNIENDRIIACSTGWSDWETMAVDYEGTPCLKCKFLGDTGWTEFPSITPDNDVHKMYLSSTEFKFDDTTLHTHSQTQYSSTNSQIRIAQSYINLASEQGYYYYYYVKIWDGKTLVRNYVPAKRLSDDKYGFYDIVNDTFNPSIGSSDFTGTSKTTPEYIYETTGGELFVNRIMCNGTQINSILCNDQSYWGNDEKEPPTPPVDTNYICGYATQANTTYSNILYINNTYHTITTDANKYWELDLADTPISLLSEDIIKTNNITSIDFRHAKFANNCDFTNMLCRNNISNLQDIYFDFTNLTDTSLIRCQGAWFRQCAGTRIHGLGTFKWTGPIDVTSDTKNFFLREFCDSSGIAGTLDLRGYDTSAITDQNPNSSKVRYANYPPSSTWGIWYNCFYGQYDTFIIGNLEMHYINNPNVTTCTTLYCTTQTPPSLGRTGTYGMQCLNYLQMYPNLQHIYVPTGCLSVYQNASIWSNYASLMSEQDAPDPLTI